MVIKYHPTPIQEKEVGLAVTFDNEKLGIKPVKITTERKTSFLWPRDIEVISTVELNMSELVPTAYALLKLADDLGVSR